MGFLQRAWPHTFASRSCDSCPVLFPLHSPIHKLLWKYIWLYVLKLYGNIFKYFDEEVLETESKSMSNEDHRKGKGWLYGGSAGNLAKVKFDWHKKMELPRAVVGQRGSCVVRTNWVVAFGPATAEINQLRVWFYEISMFHPVQPPDVSYILHKCSAQEAAHFPKIRWKN